MCHDAINWCDKRFWIYICCFIAGFSHRTTLVSKQSWSHSHSLNTYTTHLWYVISFFKISVLHGGCSTLYKARSALLSAILWLTFIPRINNKYMIQPWPFSVTWRHRTRDIRFSIGHLLLVVLWNRASIYIGFWRYWALSILQYPSRTRKPCCRRETARCRCKFWSIPSLLALCWSNISQSNAVSQWMHRVCVNTVCLKKQKNMYY